MKVQLPLLSGCLILLSSCLTDLDSNNDSAESCSEQSRTSFTFNETEPGVFLFDASESNDVDIENCETTDVETYFWTFGDGVVLNAQSSQIAHRFPELSATQSYEVTLNTYNGEGVVAHLVTVPAFEAVCDDQLDFEFKAVGTQIEYSMMPLSCVGELNDSQVTWSFGDTNTAQGDVVEHTYLDGGIFEVELSVDTPDYQSSITKTIIVENSMAELCEPKEDIMLTTVVTNNVVNFEITNIQDNESCDSIDLYNYVWSFGDGVEIITDIPSVEHEYAANNESVMDYTVSLMIANSSFSNTVTDLKIYPNIDSCITDYDLVIEPLDTFMTYGFFVFSHACVDLVDGQSATWNFGDNTVGDDWETYHEYTEIGEYVVTLSFLDINGKSYTQQRTITIADEGIPVITIAVEPVLGAENVYDFSVNSSLSNKSDVSYLWDFGNGKTSTDSNPVMFFESPNAYDVTLTSTYKDFEVKDTIIVQTQFDYCDFPRLLSPDFEVVERSGREQYGREVTLLIRNNECVSQGVTWDFGDGETLTTHLNEVTHTYTDAGIYHASVNNGVYNASIIIDIRSMPAINFTVDEVKDTQSVELTANAYRSINDLILDSFPSLATETFSTTWSVLAHDLVITGDVFDFNFDDFSVDQVVVQMKIESDINDDEIVKTYTIDKSEDLNCTSLEDSQLNVKDIDKTTVTFELEMTNDCDSIVNYQWALGSEVVFTTDYEVTASYAREQVYTVTVYVPSINQTKIMNFLIAFDYVQEGENEIVVEAIVNDLTVETNLYFYGNDQVQIIDNRDQDRQILDTPQWDQELSISHNGETIASPEYGVFWNLPPYVFYEGKSITHTFESYGRYYYSLQVLEETEKFAVWLPLDVVESN
ncbi:PKD domain-containing protein [Marinicellulosiphila megalodicopiae]|uniref:PKD domain-containing protein n=1 Tax=Marinicellulosiphila megalodicopiae TaxID=2724896 RepID=UPI003BAFC65F